MRDEIGDRLAQPRALPQHGPPARRGREDVPQRGERGGDAAERGVAQDRNVGQAGAVVACLCRGRLGHLPQREHPLLPARPTPPPGTPPPPRCVPLTSGSRCFVAYSNASAIFSPATEPIVPPMNSNSKTTSITGCPSSRAPPTNTAPRRPVRRRASSSRSR